MEHYKLPKKRQLIIKDEKLYELDRTKTYEWKFKYQLKEGNEESSYAIIFFLDENKERTGNRVKLFKKNNGEVSECIIRFQVPLYTKYASLSYSINAKARPNRLDTEIYLSPIGETELVEAKEDKEEIYDDIFDYHEKYEPVDLKKTPWLAIGSPHEHTGVIKNFKTKVETLINRYGLTPDKSVLDVGCGTAGFLNEFQHHTNSPKNYVGIDLVQKSVDFCKEKYPEFEFYKGEMTHIPDLKRKFDFICLYNVIIHMYPDDTLALLKDLQKYLKEDGKFLITATINTQITGFTGTKARLEMTDEYFADLMKRSGLNNVEKIFDDKKEGQMPFIVS